MLQSGGQAPKWDQEQGKTFMLKALQKDVKYSTYDSRRMLETKISVTE
jgi:hypothetical protein